MIDKENIRKLLKQIKFCESCGERMDLVESPPLNVGDGLGWGCEAFWLCLNNECPTFIKSWLTVKKNYGKMAGYRVMQLPNENYQSVMMVGSGEAYTGSIIKEFEDEIDPQLLLRLESGM